MLTGMLATMQSSFPGHWMPVSRKEMPLICTQIDFDAKGGLHRRIKAGCKDTENQDGLFKCVNSSRWLQISGD